MGSGMEPVGLRPVAAVCLGRRAAWRDPGIASIEGALRPRERVEAAAWGRLGFAEAGVVALTDGRILFAPRRGPVRSFPYTDVRMVRPEGCVATRRGTRVALQGAPPLHLVTSVATDLCDLIRRRAPRPG
jgi:hypothetical protein